MNDFSHAELLARIAELEAENAALKFDPAFGMLTKEGFRVEYRNHKSTAQYLIFTDLNKIHDLNAKIGEEAVDALIKQGFSFSIRETDVRLKGRAESGDEVVHLINGDPKEFIPRIHANIESVGLSAMSAYAIIGGRDLHEVLEDARAQVRKQKRARGTKRGEL